MFQCVKLLHKLKEDQVILKFHYLKNVIYGINLVLLIKKDVLNVLIYTMVKLKIGKLINVLLIMNQQKNVLSVWMVIYFLQMVYNVLL